MHKILNGKNDNWNSIGKLWLKKYDQIYNMEYFFYYMLRLGSTFIWQLKYCFQWQAYFSPNFAQSGIHKVRDIWDCEKNYFKDSNFIFNTLIDNRNWISQWTRLKRAITGDFKNILNENENNVSPSNLNLNPFKLQLTFYNILLLIRNYNFFLSGHA